MENRDNYVVDYDVKNVKLLHSGEYAFILYADGRDETGKRKLREVLVTVDNVTDDKIFVVNHPIPGYKDETLVFYREAGRCKSTPFIYLVRAVVNKKEGRDEGNKNN